MQHSDHDAFILGENINAKLLSFAIVLLMYLYHRIGIRGCSTGTIYELSFVAPHLQQCNNDNPRRNLSEVLNTTIITPSSLL